MIAQFLTVLVLAFIQNISFTLVSRSRNRDNKQYHIIASVFSNGIWFLTFRELVLADMTFILFIPFVIGTVLGSVYGMSVSMKIEKMLNASTDKHLDNSKFYKDVDKARLHHKDTHGEKAV
jgi:predicted lysophospholipase L1 biosynthesis ABC-type transport system permease subunit